MQNNKPIWLKNERPVSLFVATPVHSDVSMHYAQTMLELQKECMKRNMRVMFQMMKSSLITQGRNLCVSYFLNTDFTHMLFVCLLYTSPSPRDVEESRMPSSA